jgi:hypothetical protein
MRSPKRAAFEIERDWLKLNRAAERLCGEVLASTQRTTTGQVTPAIHRGFLSKATGTLQGVNLLMSQRLFESAEVLARVLFELRVTYDVYLRMTARDPGDASRRLMHSMMIEKYRQVAASNAFNMEGGRSKDYWEKTIAEIRAAYSPKEFDSIRRNGFTGLSMEARAQQTGHIETYNVIYRNFSRNVHSTDYMEHIGPVVFGPAFETYQHSRNVVISSTVHISALGVAEAHDNLFARGVSEPKFAPLAARRRRLNTRQPGPPRGDRVR